MKIFVLSIFVFTNMSYAMHFNKHWGSQGTFNAPMYAYSSDGEDGYSSDDQLSGNESFGGAAPYKSIETIITDDGKSTDQIPLIKHDEDSWQKLVKVYRAKKYEEENIKELKGLNIAGEVISCLLEFKELEEHMNNAEHKKYDHNKVTRFIDQNKETIASFKKTDPEIDMMKELSSIVSIHHSL